MIPVPPRRSRTGPRRRHVVARSRCARAVGRCVAPRSRTRGPRRSQPPPRAARGVGALRLTAPDSADLPPCHAAHVRCLSRCVAHSGAGIAEGARPPPLAAGRESGPAPPPTAVCPRSREKPRRQLRPSASVLRVELQKCSATTHVTATAHVRYHTLATIFEEDCHMMSYDVTATAGVDWHVDFAEASVLSPRARPFQGSKLHCVADVQRRLA
jgi:hypothetical protein